MTMIKLLMRINYFDKYVYNMYITVMEEQLVDAG